MVLALLERGGLPVNRDSSGGIDRQAPDAAAAAADWLRQGPRGADWAWAEDDEEGLAAFWLEAHPDVRVLLVMGPPAWALGAAPASEHEDVLGLLDWVRVCSGHAALRARYPDRCFLVNALAAVHAPGRLLQRIAECLALDLRFPADATPLPRPVSAVHTAAATLRMGHHGVAAALYADLDAASLLADDKLELLRLEADAAIAESMATAGPAPADESTPVSRGLRRGRSEQSLPRDPSVPWAGDPRQDLAAVRRENTLLTIQLSQVQEELEHYHDANRLLEARCDEVEVGSRGIRELWLDNHAADVRLDLRAHVEGDNWFDAETDGRWSGPRQDSTLRFPALRPGLYSVQVELVDAIAPDVLDGMRLELNGRGLGHELTAGPYPRLAVATFEAGADDGTVWCLRLHLEHMHSPMEFGSDDGRMLGVRVRSVTLTNLAP